VLADQHLRQLVHLRPQPGDLLLMPAATAHAILRPKGAPIFLLRVKVDN
jgi:hypothetical protein